MSTGVMIAFLPTDTSWCKQDLPHLTLVYCGEITSLPITAFNEIAKDAISVARFMPPFSLQVTGVEVFGEGEKVDVLTFKPTNQLLRAREMVEHWNASEHEFSAHATIGPEGSAEGVLPTELYFDRIIVEWANRQLTFRLGMNYLSENKSPDRY
jgi:2'-5' RNA ligase